MSIKSTNQLINLAEKFEKNAQSKEQFDNLDQVLTALYSIVAQLEQQGINATKLGTALSESKKMNSGKPEDLTKAKQLINSYKPIANYIAKLSVFLNKI